jgi:predicted transcriptional regulator
MKTTVSMTTSIDADLYLKLRELAEKEERSLSNMVSRAIAMYLRSSDKDELARLARIETNGIEAEREN